jgi:hypothetical protein
MLVNAATHSPTNAKLLLIAGSDKDDRLILTREAMKASGNSDVHRLLSKQDRYDRLHVTRHFFRQPRRPNLLPYRTVLNMVTDPDQNPRVLENMRKLLRGIPGRVLNPPEAVLRTTRDQIAQLLSGVDGLLVPKVVRLRTTNAKAVASAIDRAGLQFPLIARLAGTHTGRFVGRFDTLEELQGALSDGGDHIATEFIDFKSEDGLYRKYRVFFFGHRGVFRHMLVSDEWNVHAKDRTRFMAGRPELLNEERLLYTRPEGPFSPAVLETLKAVRERMPLDFFGIDFGLLPDGRVVLFEANATMNFFPILLDPKFAYVQACLRPAQLAFREMLALPSLIQTSDPVSFEPQSAGAGQ